MEESRELDFKIALDRKHPEHWMKTVCAFAMCGGGRLMVGYDDDGSFVGIPSKDVDDEVKYAVNQFRRLSSPIVVYEVSYEERPEFPGRKGIVFDIKPRKEITWLTPNGHSPLAYVREERETLPATVEEMQSRLLASISISYDAVSVGVRRDEVFFESLSDVYASTHGGKALTERDLVSYGLVDKNGFLTISGYLLCDDSDYANANATCTTWPSNDKGSHGYTDSKSFSGSILSLIDKMIGYVKSVNHYRFGGVKNGLYREDDGSFSIDSLREAFVNAVAHRDYRLFGSISVQCFPDRIEITSPGSMRSMGTATDALLEGVESDRRNETLCAMLARCGLMEERGSGFDLILADYRLLDERYAPRITAARTYFTLTLKNKKYDFGSLLSSGQGLSRPITIPKEPRFLSREELYSQNPKYRAIEELIKRVPLAKYVDIQAETGLSLAGVKYIVGNMKEACLIRRKGSAAHGYFEVVNDIDRPADFKTLDPESQSKAIGWCSRYFIPTQSYNDRHTSYGLKHTLQSFDGTYLTNGQFKGAMLLCGYEPKDQEELNWVFGISEKSPALNIKK